MFLKQEKPKMDNFERKKKLGSKGKILGKCKQKCHKIFSLILLFQNIRSIFSIFRKKTCMASGDPPRMQVFLECPLKRVTMTIVCNRSVCGSCGQNISYVKCLECKLLKFVGSVVVGGGGGGEKGLSFQRKKCKTFLWILF